MRIIAGKHKGRKLLTPRDDTIVRPTTDFTREALFSILSPIVVGARVLDLFGGTGALSLEALSRGAKSATVCDRSSESIALIRKNAAMMQEPIEIIPGDCLSTVKRLTGRKYDIIFLDPPYAMEIEAVLHAIGQCELLEEGGIIVYEHDYGRKYEGSDGWVIKDNRRYGRVALTFLVK